MDGTSFDQVVQNVPALDLLLITPKGDVHIRDNTASGDENAVGFARFWFGQGHLDSIAMGCETIKVDVREPPCIKNRHKFHKYIHRRIESELKAVLMIIDKWESGTVRRFIQLCYQQGVDSLKMRQALRNRQLINKFVKSPTEFKQQLKDHFKAATS